MRVFITGPSGFIGTAVVSELLNSGHRVMALARSEESAAKLRSLGPNVEVLFGDLEDPESLKKGAAQSDGIIHLGFIHDFSRYNECCKIDQQATEYMLESIKGTNKPFIYANGTFMLPDGKLSDEKEKRDPQVHNIRGLTEELILAYSNENVRTMVVRLAATVHGNGDRTFIPMLAEIAKFSGISGYVGDGQNVWPAVHRLDAAHLFKQALEFGSAGSVYHGVAENVKMINIAQAIGKNLDLHVTSISPEEAAGHFGTLTAFVLRDTPLSSIITRTQLNWEPKELGLLEDISANYFH